MLHQKDPTIDVVISGRKIVLDDGSLLSAAPEDVESISPIHPHSACSIGLTGLPLWALMPSELAPICDRVIYECLKTLPLKLHWHSEPTLMFESHYSNHYRIANKSPMTALHDPNWEKLRADLPILLKKFHSLTGLQLSTKA